MEVGRRRERAAGTVLVLDRLGSFQSFVREVLEPAGYRVVWEENPRSAIVALERERVGAVLVDVCVPHQGLLDGAASVLRTRTKARKVVVTGCPLMSAAARVLYPDATSVLQKPCTPEELRGQIAVRPEAGSAAGDPGLPFHRIVGASPGIARVISQIHEVAPTESTILITGETGTGKELVAEAIHQCSPRRDRPYLVVDTVALSETLLESELFGHLDEVGEIPPPVQHRLLRALQEREVRRLGAVQSSKVDVRIIAATQWDLEEAVKSGRLRADLYYRLTVYTIAIPPLRERPEDIPLLVEHALMPAGPEGGVASRCTDLALRMLESFHWPGNVRELLAVLERAQISAAGGRVAAMDLPERVRVAWREAMLTRGESREKTAVMQVLQETEGHRGKASLVRCGGRAGAFRPDQRHRSGHEHRVLQQELPGQAEHRKPAFAVAHRRRDEEDQ
jgi:DNA-binding NtrC family response regulator